MEATARTEGAAVVRKRERCVARETMREALVRACRDMMAKVRMLGG